MDLELQDVQVSWPAYVPGHFVFSTYVPGACGFLHGAPLQTICLCVSADAEKSGIHFRNPLNNEVEYSSSACLPGQTDGPLARTL